jgi:hypothetical protein
MTSWNSGDLRAAWRNPRVQLAAIFVLVLLSRLPFLDAGYGANVDAWRVARVAREIATTGAYSMSRFPGYPVQEIICSWFWRGGPYLLNGLTALLSAIAVAAFVLIARKLEYRATWLAGLALAATPIFFVSSVCSKDYIWALAFVLLGFLSVLHERPVLAGILLGLAAGCRITSLAMALPLALILLGETPPRARWAVSLKFLLITALASVLVFSPVWLRYGTRFFAFYENHAGPDWLTVLTRGTLEVWGTMGLVGLAIAASSLFWERTKSKLPNKWIVPAFLVAIVIYLGAYLRLPDQAGYLLPIVPFILLLAEQFAPLRVFQVLCLCLLVSPFVSISPKGLAEGPIFADRLERLQTMSRIRDFLAYAETLPGHNTFVVGGWEPQIAVMAPELLSARNHYVYLLNAHELSLALENSDRVFYLPLMREFNYRVHGLDLARHGALDLRAIFERQQAARERIR